MRQGTRRSPIRQHPEYKKDEKYFDSVYDFKNNYKEAIDALEGLTGNLDRRYNVKLKIKTAREKITMFDRESKKIAVMGFCCVLRAGRLRLEPCKREAGTGKHVGVPQVGAGNTGLLLVNTDHVTKHSFLIGQGEAE